MMNPIAIRYATFAGRFRDRVVDSLKRDRPLVGRRDSSLKLCRLNDNIDTNEEGTWFQGDAFQHSDYTVCIGFGIVPDCSDSFDIHSQKFGMEIFPWHRLPKKMMVAKIAIFSELRSSILDMKDVSVNFVSEHGIKFNVMYRSMFVGMRFLRVYPIATDPHNVNMFLHALAAIKYALEGDMDGIPMAHGEITRTHVIALTRQLSFIPEMNTDLEARSKRGCIVCGATRCTGRNPQNGKLYHCKCSAGARYCGVDCQRVHWLWGHREVCQ
jgi:hypothetical protein